MSKTLAKIKLLAEQHWWIAPLAIFLFWRLGLELVGRVTLAGDWPIPTPWPADTNPPLWARWDTGWMASILNYGYTIRPGQMSNVAFFPLYPLLWAGVKWLSGTSRLMAGVLTANLMAFFAILVFYRLAFVSYGVRVANRATAALLAFPTSFFLIAAYSESTFLFFISLCLLLATRGRFGWAALAAGATSATRHVGILLWPILFWLWSTAPTFRKPRHWLPLIILPPLGLVLFSIYLGQTTGEPLAWFTAHAAWGRHFALPFKTIYSYANSIWLRDELAGRYTAELAALAFALVLLPRVWKLSKAYAGLVVLALIPMLLSGTFVSLRRLVLVLPPLFLALGTIEKRWLFITYLLACIPLLALSIGLFVTWQWAG